MSKTIQLGGFLGKILENVRPFRQKITNRPSVPSDVLPKLATKVISSALDKSERKISCQGAVKAGKGFDLFISNGDMDDIIKIVESLGKSDLLIDGATETVKHEIKKERGFLGAMMAPVAASFIAPMAS